MEELTFDQLYADLVAASSETMPERYFTLTQFCTDTGLKTWAAKKRLAEYVENGKMATRPAVVNGHRMLIWWFLYE